MLPVGHKISGLPAASAVSDSDQLETNQAGVSRRITVGQVTEKILDAIVGTTSAIVTPMAFGAVGDGVANDTLAVQNAAAYALANGAWLDGLSKWYGVSECSIPVDSRMRDIKFREVNPNTSDERRTVKVMGNDTPGSSVRMERVVVDRNGDGTRGLLNYAGGLWIERVDKVHIEAEVFGNGMGNGIVVRWVNGGYVNVFVHDMQYVFVAQTDDVMCGLAFAVCQFITGYARVERLGRTDQTTAERDTWTRGVSYSDSANMGVYHTIYRVDQGCDVSGDIGNYSISVAGKYSHCSACGPKIGNSQIACDFQNVIAEHCGFTGLAIGGGAYPTTNRLRNNLLSGWVARNIGTNGLVHATGNTTAGCHIRRSAPDPLGAQYPKGLLVNDFMCVSDEGTTTFTVNTTTDVCTPISDDSIPISTGVRVQCTTTGTLPAPLTPGTNYWLLDTHAPLSFKLSSSFINAQDEIAIDFTTAGTGTHTMVLQSDCDYAVTAQENAHFDPDQPNILGTGYASGMIMGKYIPSSTIRLAHRELLLRNRTYFVRTDALGTGPGTIDTPAGAFGSVHFAIEVIQDTLDIPRGITVTIQVNDGSFATEIALVGTFVGGGLVIIKGNAANPAAVQLHGSTHTFNLDDGARLVVQDVQLTTNASGGSCLFAQNNGRITFSNVDFAAAAGRHMYAVNGGLIEALGNYSLSGNAVQHKFAQRGGKIITSGRTCTIPSALAFNTFARADQGDAAIIANAMSFAGAGVAGTTGLRFVVENNATIYTDGGGANYFPGGTPGTFATSGVYC